MKDDRQWVAVAIVMKPHGLGGALVLKPLTRTADEFMDAPLKRVYVRRKGEIVGQLTIVSMSVHKNVPLVTVEEVNDRNEAEALYGAELVIPEAERWPLPKGQYYVDELEGVELIDSTSGQSYGPVVRAADGAAHDYLVFMNPTDPKKEVMLPIIKQFVQNVDIANKRALVTLPAGLLEL
ncbi:hypothetical protein BH09SUM1_BH09SUM1_19650 [soil metagenome]